MEQLKYKCCGNAEYTDLNYGVIHKRRRQFKKSLARRRLLTQGGEGAQKPETLTTSFMNGSYTVSAKTGNAKTGGAKKQSCAKAVCA